MTAGAEVPQIAPNGRKALSILSLVVSGVHIFMTPLALRVFGVTSLVCLGLGVIAFRRVRNRTGSDLALGNAALAAGLAAVALTAAWAGVALVVSGPAAFADLWG